MIAVIIPMNLNAAMLLVQRHNLHALTDDAFQIWFVLKLSFFRMIFTNSFLVEMRQRE